MKNFIIQILFSLIPDTRLFEFKNYLLRLTGKRIGKNVRIVSSAKIRIPRLDIGDNSFIGHETMIIGGISLVKIGKNCDIGPRCTIVTGTHNIGSKNQRAGKGKSLDIFIGDGTWIGSNCTLVGGITIGCGCIVGAKSLVRSNFGDNLLIVGIPAKAIKRI